MCLCHLGDFLKSVAGVGGKVMFALGVGVSPLQNNYACGWVVLCCFCLWVVCSPYFLCLSFQPQCHLWGQCGCLESQQLPFVRTKSMISLVTDPCSDGLLHPHHWNLSQKADICPIVLVAGLCFKREMNILF